MKEWFAYFEKEIGKLYKQIQLKENEKRFAKPDLLKKSKVMQIVLTGLILDQEQLDEFIRKHPQFKSLITTARKEVNNPSFIKALKDLSKKYPAQIVSVENVELNKAIPFVKPQSLLSAKTEIGECGINLYFTTSKPGGTIFSYVAWELPINMSEEINPFKKMKVLSLDLTSDETNLHVVQMLFMLYSENIEKCALRVGGDLSKLTKDSAKLIFSNLPENAFVCIDDSSEKSQELAGLLKRSFQVMMIFTKENFDAAKRSWYESIMNSSTDFKVGIDNLSFDDWLERDKNCLIDLLSKKPQYSLVLSDNASLQQELKLVETLLQKGQVINLNDIQKNTQQLYDKLKEKFPGYTITMDRENDQIKIDSRTPANVTSHEASPVAMTL